MSRIFNLLDGSVEPAGQARDGHRFSRRRLTESFDTKLVGFSVYELPAGEAAWAYHYELQREEWLLVVAGEVMLRTPAGERAVRAGDVVCFVPGEAGAHAVRNASASTVRFAIFSSHERFGYAAVRPDSNTVLVVGPGFRRIVPLDEERDYWEGEP